MEKKVSAKDHPVPSEDASSGTVEPYRETKRGLASRHVQLMAIGGSIGTGLFVGIGSYLRDAGPLSLLLGYMFWGCLFILPVNLSVGEMVAYLPVRGSIFELAARFIDPAFGFAMGWVYFYGCVMLVCTEYAAVATVMQYWNTSVNPAVWVAMALIVCSLLNFVAVKYYGESEFIMASTKILLLIGLVLLTFITMVGGNPKHDAYGFRNWTHGVMFEYYTDGVTGRFLGFFSVMVYAAFSVAGPDLPALAAGEIQNPRYTIPRVVKATFWRIVGFYVVGVLAIGIICSPRDPRLMSAIDSGAAGSAASPWVIGIENLGISGLPDLINLLILLSGWSCGNAYLYSSSRTLYSLARDGQAPKFLLKCTASGIPVYCVLTVSLLSCVTFLVAGSSSVTVFYWFVDLTTIAFVLTYTGMLCVFIGWYRALKAQGIDRKQFVPWASPWQPYAAIWAICIGSVTAIFNGFSVFKPFSVQGFVTSYFGLAFWVVMYVFWKVYHRTKLVNPAEADLYSGKAEVDEECKLWEDGGWEERRKAELAQMNWGRRVWEKMW
ncbi:hypothetical protein N7448_003647 [Penicillium atrosanguineum]|uniref:Amino acid permease/ SLC12A domain-containing protein n=1 Tax=Penicillium atrosanguineum TaxID=1132637 RepID=A0A9W9H9M3_9EURO|nr:beta-glucosidase D [Penicillium atrosanguineum]KAJ5122515.1 hypothetical protein N7526_009452 [Penicillium atrosanguineum]KAJ5140239.1 hypothetical protein N7448_003647 [Penicillium atrosanguineum]KAJ5310156.1 beta-glucosidase D [Penicillium atrosanguineum]KAJ5315672.1 hypothetical protein N7476_005979 [Penicillium atrosanguineum]